MSSGSPNTQKIELPFSGGLAQQFHPRHAPMGAALVSKNGRYTRDGGYAKRLGNARIGTIGNAGDGRLISRGSELASIDPTGIVYSYAPSASGTGDAMVRRYDTPSLGNPSVLVTKAQFHTPTRSLTSTAASDVAYGNGIIVHVWVEVHNGGVYYSLRRETDDAESAAVQLSTTGICPRVCYVSGGTPSGQFIVAYANTGTNNISAVAISASTHQITAGPTNVATNNRTAGDIDIAPMSDRWVLAYATSTATTSTCTSFTNALVQVNTLSVNDALAVTKFGWGIDATSSDNIWVGHTYASGGTNFVVSWCINPATFLNRAGFPFTVGSSATDTYYQVTPKRRSSTLATFCVSGIGPAGALTSSAPFLSCPVVTSAGAISGLASLASRRTNWTWLASKPFIAPNGMTCALVQKMPAGTGWASNTNTFFSSYFVANLNSGETSSANRQVNPISNPTCARTALYGSTPGKPSAAVAVDAGSTRFRANVLERRAGDGSFSYVNITMDFAATSRFAGTDVGRTAYYSPGGTYDGQLPYEMGFLDWPQRIAVAMVGAGTGAIAAGTYYWCATYTIYDANGNGLTSQVSTPVSATAAANDTALIRVPALTTSLMQSHNGALEERRTIRIDVYRTNVGGTADGPFFLCPTQGFNDVRAVTQVVTDALADASYAGQPVVYTDGGVLGNVCPPSLRHLVTYKSRLCGVGDDGRTVWFSKAFVENETPGWCDAFTLAPLDDSETIAALAVMDDALIAFTRNRVYWTSFDGPADTGGASDVGPWRRLPVDMGCIDSRSVVTSQLGVIFQSSLGIQLLNRGRALQQPTFGLPVQTDHDTYPVITSAVVHPTNGCIYISAATATDLSDRDGRVFVFDYSVGMPGKWSTDERRGFSDSQMHVKSQIVLDGRVYWLGSDLSVYQEALESSSVAYLDDGRFVPRIYETAWVKPAGLQAWMSIVKWILMAERYTSHGLQVALYADYSDTAIETQTYTAATLDALTSEQLMKAPAIRKAQAYKIRVTETAPVTLGSGRGAEWIALALEIDGLDKTIKLPTAQRS